MARELTPSELDELLGAFALDAVDDDEVAQVEEYLARSVEAQAEVAALREVAAMLAHSDGGAAPEGLWSRIEGALGAEPPSLVLPIDRARNNRARRGGTDRRGIGRTGIGTRGAVALAAAAVAAALVVGIVVNVEMSRQGDRLDQVASSVERDGVRRAAMAAMADPRGRMLQLEAVEGAGTATVVTMPDGEGFLMAHDVPRLAKGRTYQLWAMTGDADTPALVSAGVLGRGPDVVAFRAPAATHGFVVTAEADPGVTSSSQPAQLAGRYAEA